MSQINLFCFHYAGGSATVFSSWRKHIHPQIKLIPVETAGRGMRMNERLYADIDEATEDVFALVLKYINNNEPYAFFGHSMGSLLCYKLVQKLARLNLELPQHIFFSGRGAPHIERPDKVKYHLLNAKEFEQEVLKLGGTPPEFFEHKELMNLFLPILKNDFKIIETSIINKEIVPMEVDISVFIGEDDDLTAEQRDGWKLHTNRLCTEYYFKGGHFFLHQQTEKIVKIINDILIEENCYNL
jgi:medium-chain acyl-[acyl-carrier-protein] hydrolase